MSQLDDNIRKGILESRKHNNGLTEPLKDIILNHGSRGGIEGDIQPTSRLRCDFGKGFYLGDSDMQAKSLVINDQAPWFYKIRLHLTEIDPQKVLVLNDRDWLYTILAHRKTCPEFSSLEIAKRTIDKTSKYDVVIGPIADDRMNEAITAFSDYALTDKGLYECLKYVDYGNQYVLKTREACALAEIIDEKPLKGQEMEHIRKFTDQERSKARNVVKEMTIRYQRQGMYINELIDMEKRKERERYAK